MLVGCPRFLEAGSHRDELLELLLFRDDLPLEVIERAQIAEYLGEVFKVFDDLEGDLGKSEIFEEGVENLELLVVVYPQIEDDLVDF